MTTQTQAWSIHEGSQRVKFLADTSFSASASSSDNAAPAIVASAPGRVNLIGEHTDYNGGLALPIALPHRTYACLRPRPDRTVRLTSAQADPVELDLDTVGPHDSTQAVAGWAAYAVGVAWAAEQEGIVESCPGFDLAIDSCVPFGAGLSSSAALECAVAAALCGVLELPLDDDARAHWARVCVRAENDVAGAPTGGMDQAASLRCQAGHALLLDCRDGSTELVPFDLAAAGLELLVIDTRAEHALVDGQYAARRADCERAAELLGVDLLADIDDLPAAVKRIELSDIPEADRERLRRRVRHVVGEIQRTRDFAALLTHGAAVSQAAGRACLPAEDLGVLMNESHYSLRDDYEVSCPELDVATETARQAGAYGARMTGGGFGGSAIALVRQERADQCAAAVEQAFADHGWQAPQIHRAVASDPAAFHA